MNGKSIKGSSKNNQSYENKMKGQYLLQVFIASLLAVSLACDEKDNECMAKDALKFTNEYRNSKEKKPLIQDAILMKLAMKWAEKMMNDNMFEHQEIRRLEGPPGTFVSAENIAKGDTVGDDMVKQIVDGWIASPGHERNIVSDSTHVGFGFYRSAQGYWWATQLFAQCLDKSMNGCSTVDSYVPYLPTIPTQPIQPMPAEQPPPPMPAPPSDTSRSGPESVTSTPLVEPAGAVQPQPPPPAPAASPDVTPSEPQPASPTPVVEPVDAAPAPNAMPVPARKCKVTFCVRNGPLQECYYNKEKKNVTCEQFADSMRKRYKLRCRNVDRRPVCATNGRSYMNLCVMHIASLRNGFTFKMLHNSYCKRKP